MSRSDEQHRTWPSFSGRLAGGEVAWRVVGSGLAADAGDFCDVLTLRDGSSLVVCGDVCGHGRRAAADARTARSILRRVAGREVSLPRLVARFNDRLISEWRGRERTTFATACFVRVEQCVDGLRATCVSAGHPLPLVLRTDRSIETLGRPGALLGIFPDAHIETVATTLRKGDAIVVYTDGIVDGLDPQDGSPSLADLVSGCGDASAEEIGDCVMLAVAEATTGASDDHAVLVVRASGDEPVSISFREQSAAVPMFMATAGAA